MKILVIGPKSLTGSLPPYIRNYVLSPRELGAHVDWVGSPGVPDDEERGQFFF